MHEPHRGRGPKRGQKFSPDERIFIGRVISRLRMKPIYMPVKTAATTWGISTEWAHKMCNEVRGL